MPEANGHAPPAATAASGLTVFVPCFNDGPGIGRIHREIVDALGTVDDLEILLVDDGSTDDTLERMRELATVDPRVRYLSFSRNFGLEAAQSAGFRYASKPWTAQLDSDLQKPPSEIRRLLAAAADGYDVVFGVPPDRQDPLVRRLGSRAQRWVAERVFGVRLPPGATTFRVIRTGVARTLVDLRLGQPYFVAMVGLVGARWAVVPTEHRADEGRSRWRWTRLVGHSFELFYGHSWRPLNGLYLVAALGVLAATITGVLAIAGVLTAGAAGAVCAGLTATTLAAVALVGRYLQRAMLDHRASRPYYVREANVPLRGEDRMDGGEPYLPPPPVAIPRPRAAADAAADIAGLDATLDAAAASLVTSAPLLVLGASEDQLPVYEEAARRGIPTIAVDWWTDRPSLRLAQRHLHVSTTDTDAIVAALGDTPLCGVVAASSDASLRSWAELGTRYGAPYRFPLSAAVDAADKIRFHAIAAAAGAPRRGWAGGDDRSELLTAAADLTFPVVVKPADSSGSKGVVLVTDPSDLAAALAAAAGHSPTGRMLVEEYVAGRNLTIDVFVRGGEVVFAGVTEKRMLPGDGFLIGGHVCPAPIPDDVRAELTRLAGRLLAGVGLTDGPANIDVVLDAAGEIHVLEANARLCGNAVPRLMRAVYGVDTVAALVSMALGEPYDLTTTRSRAGIIHVIASPLDVDGTLTRLDGVDEVAAMPGVELCRLYADVGDVVKPFTQAGHKFGYLVVSGDDAAAADAVLATALGKLTIVVEPRPAPESSPDRALLEGTLLT